MASAGGLGLRGSDQTEPERRMEHEKYGQLRSYQQPLLGSVKTSENPPLQQSKDIGSNECLLNMITETPCNAYIKTYMDLGLQR